VVQTVVVQVEITHRVVMVQQQATLQKQTASGMPLLAEVMVEVEIQQCLLFTLAVVAEVVQVQVQQLLQH
jgi:hypothetical protein